MSAKQYGLRGFLTGVLFFLSISGTCLADTDSSSGFPPIVGSYPFFYYNDIERAEIWYEEKLGLRKISDHGWLKIFEIVPGAYIGLVDASGGTLKPTENKGAMLSLETEDLEAWYELIQGTEGITIKMELKEYAHGLIDAFTIEDPGGYLVEFFRWKEQQMSKSNELQQ